MWRTSYATLRKRIMLIPQRSLGDYMTPIKLSENHALTLVMWQVYLHGALSATNLARILDELPMEVYETKILPERLSPILQSLTGGGLLRVKPKGRGHQYMLTDAGRKRLGPEIHEEQAFGEALKASTKHPFLLARSQSVAARF